MNNNGLSLNSNKLVKGTLQFVVGKIATGGHTLTVGEDCEAVGSIVGSGEGKYVNGKLRRYVASASDPGVYFPIGDTSNFTPVTIDFSGDLSSEACGYLEASTMVQGPAEGALPAGAGLSPVKYANRRWKIDNSGVGGFSEYAITLRYNVNDLAGNANPALLSMRKFSGGAWSNVSIGARGLNSAKGIGLTSFSEFVLGESCDIEALSCILDDLCQTGDGARFYGAERGGDRRCAALSRSVQ